MAENPTPNMNPMPSAANVPNGAASPALQSADAAGGRQAQPAADASFRPADAGFQAARPGAGHAACEGAQTPPVPPFSAEVAGQAVPPQSAAPQPVCAPFQPPAPQLTGGMKFGYFALGFLGNLLGILVSWLINADKHPALRNSAIKWSVVGFAATFAIGIVVAVVIFGMLGAFFTALGAGAYAYDPTAYYYL